MEKENGDVGQIGRGEEKEWGDEGRRERQKGELLTGMGILISDSVNQRITCKSRTSH